MNSHREEIVLHSPSQGLLDTLLASGIALRAMIRPTYMRAALGHRARDGLFDCDPDGAEWLVFQEAEDWVCWNVGTGDLATYCGRAFALGADRIHEAATYSFGFPLTIYATPLEWLTARRDGIVVLDWTRAFDHLRDCPRIAVPESLYGTYNRHMRPCRMPSVLVIRSGRRHAA
jgi:hypothetical protein